MGGDPERRACEVEVMRPVQDVSADRLRARRGLLANLDRVRPDLSLRRLHDKAHRLLDSAAIRRALDIEREPLKGRERYGFGPAPVAVGEGGGGGNGAEMGVARQMRGQNLLLARRLVEAGGPVRHVHEFKNTGPKLGALLQGLTQDKT